MVNAIVGLLQLVALGAFAFGVYTLNQMAPKRMAARVFKLHWLLATLGGGLVLFLLLAKPINLPARLQTTPASLVKAHDMIRAECSTYFQALKFDDAYNSIQRRSKTAELVGEHNQKMKEVGKTSLQKLLGPFLNAFLFHTGVAIAFVPALLRLLLLLWQKRRLQSSGHLDAQFESRERREWGVFLPIMNVVTLLSLCVSPTFYFFIEPGRASRCIYSSGHWYTFTCTCMTFAIVITHLYRNRDYCKRSLQLLSWYFVWFVAYLGMAMMVLKNTQTFYHDSIEAVDGMMQALPSFALFTVVLIAYQFVTASSRDLQPDDTDSGAASTASLSSKIPAATAKAKKILGLIGDASSSKAKKVLGLTDENETAAEEQVEPQQKTSSKKKGSNKKTKKDSPIPAAPAAPAAEEDEEDAVIVDAPEPSESPVKEVPQAPSAPPMAPPPPAPSASSSGKRTDIKIPTTKSQPKAQAVNPQDELLANIRKGVALKHTTTKTGGSGGSAPTGMMAVLQAKLANARVAIDGEKAESDEDEFA